jgi:hypothetical protein
MCSFIKKSATSLREVLRFTKTESYLLSYGYVCVEILHMRKRSAMHLQNIFYFIFLLTKNY